MFLKAIKRECPIVNISRITTKQNVTFTQNDFIITKQAKVKLNEFPNKFLRISVQVGGCHGFEYTLDLVDRIESQDIIFDRVLVDKSCFGLLKGSTLDYKTELIGSSFEIKNNPNSESSCGCNASFSLKDRVDTK